jgi:ABC-2 type transport system ATP-binding protein
MHDAVISVRALSKEYRSRVKSAGLAGAIRSLVRPETRTVLALQDVSFDIGRGEVVGYLGPNGAGKSTTIKLLSGVLHPTRGELRVAGLEPQRRRGELALRIGVLFGQRSQLYWDLRLGESFDLVRCMYGIDRATFAGRLSELSSLLGIADLVDRPVRQLSLGQRMRAELCAAVLHHPDVLFLDEPTIALDVAAKQAVREVVQALNRTLGTTIVLTSHDLREVERLCSRVIIINAGTIVADGSLAALRDRLAPYRVVRVTFDGEATQHLTWPGAVIVSAGADYVTARVDTANLPAFLSHLATGLRIRDLTIAEPDIEEVVGGFYGQTAVAPS